MKTNAFTDTVQNRQTIVKAIAKSLCCTLLVI